MLKHGYWTLPLALMALSPAGVSAQGMPVETFDSAAPSDGAVAPLAEVASAPSFAQLSSTAPVTAKRPAADRAAAASMAPLDDDREALWLPLAGVAALAFVASRNRRAYRTESSRAGPA